MTKTFRILLLSVLAIVFGGSAATAQGEGNTATWLASSGDPLSTIYVGNDITLKWEEGGGDMAPKYSGGYVYFYNGNRVTVAGASEEVKVQSVVFKFKDDTKVGMATCNASGKNVSTEGITNDNSAYTSTWEGDAASVIFRAAQGTGVRYIESITVTYIGSSAVVEKKPVLAITSDGVADTYDMDANGVFVVRYANTGTAAAGNAKLAVYVDGSENTSVELGTVAIGAEGWKNVKYNVETIAAGEHQVYLSLTADNADAVQTEAKAVNFTKKAPEATFEISAQNVSVQLPVETIDVVATVKNTSEVAAQNVTLNLWKNGVIATQAIDALAAGETTNVTFTIDAPEAGEYDMQVLTADNKYGCHVTVTVLAAPVEEVRDLAVTDITGTLDLANETNNVRISVANNGNVDIADAAVTLKAGDTVLGQATVTAAAGQTAWCYVAVASAGLVAGQLDVTATVDVEGDATPADNTMNATLTVKAVVVEATFEVAAADVTVPYDATTFSIVASVKNTSETAAENVEVKLTKGIEQVGEAQVIATLAAGEEREVTFTVADGPFAAGTATYYVSVDSNKAIAEVTVTVEEAPVTPVFDLAITEVIGTIDLALESNSIRVTVENRGNQDITDAPVTLKAGEQVLGTATVSAKAAATGWCMVPVATDGLQAGDLNVTAIVEVADDATSADNTLAATVTVKGVAAPEATFSVTAQDVSVEYGAEAFTIVATVTNTSAVNAAAVEVKLLSGADVVATKTIEALAAGEQQDVSFTFPIAVYEAGTTATFFVQVAGKAQTEVAVTFSEEPVVEVVDLAVTAIQGTLDLSVATNYLTVFVQNNGTVDVNDATVTLYAGETVLGTGTVSAKAGSTGMCTIGIDTTVLSAGELEVKAVVTVEGDATPDDNTMTKSYEVTTAVAAIQAAYGENVQIYNLHGKKVSSLRSGQVYIINNKKVMVK